MADGEQRTTDPQALHPPLADQPYRLVLERIHDGVAFVASSGDISYCNRRFADILGVPVETVIGGRLGRSPLLKLHLGQMRHSNVPGLKGT